MIIAGLILLLAGMAAHAAVLWTVGNVVLIAGMVLLMLGITGRAVRGRRHFY
ncbi:MAG: hypothetical protein ACXVFO_19170 [Solirubrobacteraceae bacterium]